MNSELEFIDIEDNDSGIDLSETEQNRSLISKITSDMSENNALKLELAMRKAGIDENDQILFLVDAVKITMMSVIERNNARQLELEQGQQVVFLNSFSKTIQKLSSEISTQQNNLLDNTLNLNDKTIESLNIALQGQTNSMIGAISSSVTSGINSQLKRINTIDELSEQDKKLKNISSSNVNNFSHKFTLACIALIMFFAGKFF